jgi:hypothetical protein
MVYKCNVLRIFPYISLMRGLIGLSGNPSVNMFKNFGVWDINFLEEQGGSSFAKLNILLLYNGFYFFVFQVVC